MDLYALPSLYARTTIAFWQQAMAFQFQMVESMFSLARPMPEAGDAADGVAAVAGRTADAGAVVTELVTSAAAAPLSFAEKVAADIAAKAPAAEAPAAEAPAAEAPAAEAPVTEIPAPAAANGAEGPATDTAPAPEAWEASPRS